MTWSKKTGRNRTGRTIQAGHYRTQLSIKVSEEQNGKDKTGRIKRKRQGGHYKERPGKMQGTGVYLSSCLVL
jgi:hypothetical protein